MSGFDRVVVVDWSARATPSPRRPSADAIWIAEARGGAVSCTYHRTREAATDALGRLFDAALAAGERVLAGFDFPFAYPSGFAARVTGSDDPLRLWEALAARVEDRADNSNNRFEVAAALNDLFPGTGPFWGCPEGVADSRLPARGSERHGHGLPERRAPEHDLPRAQPCWKLYTTGSVGSQALLGIPRLQSLRARFGAALAVRPFETRDAPIVLVELFPSLIAGTVADLAGADEIRDRAQVRVLAAALAALDPGRAEAMTREGDPVEGWILGLGHAAELDAAARRAAPGPSDPPPLANDCFALPPGIRWTPVAEALGLLRERLRPVAGIERVPLSAASERILAEPLAARRANPAASNSAVDGYGFAGPAGEGVQRLGLVDGRAAAGAPFPGRVGPGEAVRILTGAILPDGVDTVVLQEDVGRAGDTLSFRGPVAKGANTRPAGEDAAAGAPLLQAGRRLTPGDLALLAATGWGEVPVRRRLRVGVLSTGDELVDPGAPAAPHQVFDANRAMLLAVIGRWGYAGVDLGRVGDSRARLRAALDSGAGALDAILTTGGASAGDEDHVSALLREAGALREWRIALKPGRPLALGLWNGMPVFGLPGNPVAALVCTLIFARPALGLMAGRGWLAPSGLELPAGFAKRKKAGRREYLRARLREGRVEVFASEGSGRIAGLSWAEGLVELDDAARTVSPGDTVRYLPLSDFDL